MTTPRWKLFVISLRRARERRLQVIEQLADSGLPFEIVDAFDAVQVRPEFLAGGKGAAGLNAGVVACYHSHIGIYQRIVDYGLDYALILEDDFVRNDFEDLTFENIWDRLPAGADHIQLHAFKSQFSDCYRVEEKGVIFNKLGCTNVMTVGYIISSRLAKFMLKCHSTPKMPIDWQLIEISKQGIFDFYDVTNGMVSMRWEFPSEINRIEEVREPEDPDHATFSQRERLNVGLVTLWTPAIHDWALRQAQDKERYCDKWDVKYYGYQDVLSPERAPTWSKIVALRNHLADHDWLVWMDADAAITNGMRDVRDFLDDGADLIITNDHAGFNAGIFMIRNSPAALRFLERVWEEDVTTFHFEQTAMIRVMKEMDELRIRVLPKRSFNSYWFDHRPGDFIFHAAGENPDARVKLLTAFSNAYAGTLLPDVEGTSDAFDGFNALIS